MSDLKDTYQIDVAAALTELDRVDKAIDRLFRARPIPPSPVPPLPGGGGSGGRGGAGQSAAQKELAEVANRLKVAQNELKQLGDNATTAQLAALQAQIAGLTTRAQALGPGFAAGGREARILSGVLLGLQGTSQKVSGSLDRLIQGPRGANDPEGLRQLRQRIADVGNQIATTRNQFIQLSGNATKAEIDALTSRMAQLKTQANLLAQGLPAGSKELRQLAAAAAQAERTIAGANGQMSRLGLASQTRLGVAAGIQDVQQTVGGALNGITQIAKFTDGARVASLLFEAQLRRQNIALDEGSAVSQRLANTLKILPSQAQDSIQVLLRNGFTLQQAYTALERAGASALARGRTAGDGVDLFAQAIQSQSSAMLNFIGISGNLSDFYYQYAKSIGTTANKLDQQQKAQAAVNLVTKETTEELANLPILQASVAGGFSDLATAQQELTKTVGKSFSGPVADTVKGLKGLASGLNELPRPLVDGGARLALFVVGLVLFTKIGLVVRAQLIGIRAELANVASGGGLAARGWNLLTTAFALSQKTIPGLVAELGLLKAAALSVTAVLAAGAAGYGVGTFINSIDTGKGTVGDQIQLKSLQSNSILLRLLGVTPEMQEAAAKQLADDLNGVTKKAEEKYALAAGKGGDRYAGLLRVQDYARQQNDESRAKLPGSDAGEKAELQASIARNEKLITSLEKRRDAILKAKAAANADVASTEQQDEAYQRLRGSLTGLSEQYGKTKTTSFQTELVAAQKAIQGFQKDIDKALKNGDITKKQGDALKASQKTALQSAIPNLVDRQLETNRKAALTGQRELEEARVKLIRDGVAQREAELKVETGKISDEYKVRINEAKQNAGARGLSNDQQKSLNAEAVRLEGERDEKIRLVRVTAQRELENLEYEHGKRVLDAQRSAGEANVGVLQAGLAAQLQARDEALSGTGSEGKRLQIERQSGVQIVALQQQLAGEQRRIKEASLAQDLASDLRAARDAGAQKHDLEVAARQKYGSSLRALEISSRTETAQAVIDQTQRENEAVAKLEQRQLDQTLRGLSIASGAELESIRRRLEARKALAEASGNGPLSETLSKAIESVTQQAQQNLDDFTVKLRDAGEQSADLRDKLRDIATTPLQKAEKAASSPFDDVLKTAEKQRSELQKAYAKIPRGEVSDTQLQDFRNREVQLSGIITLATTQRTQARAAADTKYYRDLADKAEESNLTLSKRELELGKITIGQYAVILAGDKAYWESRKKNAVSGSDDETAATQKLRENEDERLRLANESRQLTKDRAGFVKEELQTSLDLASSDAERLTTISKLNQADQGRLAAIDQELEKLQAQGGHERQILELEQERAKVKKDVVQRQREEEERARALLESVEARTAAEASYAEKSAKTDAAVAAARGQALGGLRGSLSGLDAQIVGARSETQRNTLIAKRFALLGQIADLQKTIDDAPLTIEQRRLDLYKAQRQERLVLNGLNDDAVATAQQAVDFAERDLKVAKEKTAAAKTQAEKDTSTQGEAEATTALTLARQQLSQAPLVGEQRRLDLYKAQAATRLILSGLDDDAVASASNALDIAERDLKVAQDKLSLAQTPVQREEAQTGVEQALGAREQARRQLALAPLEGEQRHLDLLKAQVAEQLQLAGLADDAVATAKEGVRQAQADLVIASDKVRLAQTPVQREGAITGQTNARTALAQAEERLALAPLEGEQRHLDLLKAQEAVRLQLAGLSDDAVASAREAVRQAQEELNLASRRVKLAQTPVQQETAATGEANARAALAQAQQRLVLAPLDDEQRHLNLLKAQVAQRLELAGLTNSGVATAQAAVDQAQRELDLAKQRVTLSRTRASIEEAQTASVTAQTTLLQAQGNLVKARLDAEQRQLELSKARASTQLELSGLADNVVAKADQAVRFAESDLALARERVALARTEDDLRTTQQGELSAQTALSQAQRAAVQARVQAAQQALDIQEAQVRGAAQLVGLADDAVASAQIDLDVTRQKLSLTGQQLDSADKTRLTQEQITTLLREQTGLQGQAAEQERKLAEAQRARVTLLKNLGTAQRKLGNEALGGSPEARGTREALLGIAEARSKLTQAEREYVVAQADVNRVQSSTNIEKYRTATEGLTSAISGQRSALGTLASQYAALLGSMDGVRDAGDKLKSVLYGEQGQPFNSKRETDRFSAIQARRDAALKAAQTAVQDGDPAQIAQTTQELAKQEERYRKQAELLEKNGVEVTLRNETAVSKLADQVDRLGIQYDREADLVKQKADAALAESQAAVLFGAGATTFEKGVDTFGAKVAELSASLEKPIKLDLPPLKLDVPEIPPITADQALLSAIEKLNAEDRQARTQAGPPDAGRERAAALERGIAADNALNAKYFSLGGILEQERRGGGQSAPPPMIRSQLAADIAFALRPNANAVQQAVNQSLSKIRNSTPLSNPNSNQSGGRTVNNNQRFDLTINVPAGSSPEDFAQAFRRELANINREAEIFAECP